MIGIYNEIELSSADNSPLTISGDRLHIYADDNTSITSFIITGLYAYQAGTPTPDANLEIYGTAYAYYNVAPTESATGSRYSKSLNRTIYGGYIDLVTGKLTKTYDIATLDASSYTWTLAGSGSTRRFYATVSGMSTAGYDTTHCLCTHAKYIEANSMKRWGEFYYENGRVNFCDRFSQFASVDAFTAWLGSNTVQIVYPLTEPVVYNLSTSTIQKLSGDTYYYSTSGSLTMTVLQALSDAILKRPSNFSIQRENIYAGEYTTCTGATRADLIGWKYSDVTLEFDELTEAELNKLTLARGLMTFKFKDSDGEHTERVIKTGFTNTPTRYTLPNGAAVWRDVGLSLRFVDAHN